MSGKPEERRLICARPMGYVAGMVNKIQPAADIVKEIVQEATELLRAANNFVVSSSKL